MTTAGRRLWDWVIVAVAAWGIVRIAVMLPTRVGRNDFSHYYLAYAALHEPPNPYAASLTELCTKQGFEVDPMLPHLTDPPGLLWFFAWMHWLPVRVAFWTWVAAQIGSLLAVLAMTCRLVGDRLTP